MERENDPRRTDIAVADGKAISDHRKLKSVAETDGRKKKAGGARPYQMRSYAQQSALKVTNTYRGNFGDFVEPSEVLGCFFAPNSDPTSI